MSNKTAASRGSTTATDKSSSATTHLEDVIAGGNLEAILEALVAADHTNPNLIHCESGHYVLGLAASHGHLDICRYFVEEQKADIHQRANDGSTAFQLAARGGFVPVMKYLMGLGADINESDNDGLSPFAAAAMNGHADAVQFLLGRMPSSSVSSSTAASNTLDFGATDKSGFTPLMRAAVKGNGSIVKMLLKAINTISSASSAASASSSNSPSSSSSGSVNAVNGQSASALYFAAKEGHLAVVKALLAARADPNGVGIWDKEVTVASTGANRVQRTSCCPFGPPLYVAAEKGHLEVVKALVEAGADMNVCCGASGATALYAAAEEGHVKVVKYLVSDAAAAASEAAFESSNAMGATAAAAAGDASTFTIAASKADVNARNVQDSSPLFIACYKDYADMAKALLAAGADAAALFAGDCTCLYVAAQNGNLKAVKALLDYQKTSNANKDIAIDAQVVSQAGMTALCVATANNHYDIVKALVGAGADLFVKVGKNEDCVRIANDRNLLKIHEYLVQMAGQQLKKKGGK